MDPVDTFLLGEEFSAVHSCLHGGLGKHLGGEVGNFISCTSQFRKAAPG